MTAPTPAERQTITVPLSLLEDLTALAGGYTRRGAARGGGYIDRREVANDAQVLLDQAPEKADG